MILDRQKLAESKVEQLAHGYTAFTDSTEVARLMKREIEKLHLDIEQEVTPIGSWFIPQSLLKSEGILH